MTKHRYAKKLLPLILGAVVALSSCSAPITDGDPSLDSSGSAGADSSEGGEPGADAAEEDPVPQVVYAQLTLVDDGQIECAVADEPGPGMSMEVKVDAAGDPADKSVVCADALADLDEAGVRAGAGLAAKIRDYVAQKPAADVQQLGADLDQLDAALESDWESVPERVETANGELKKVKKAVKKAAEAEKKRKAEADAKAKEKAKAQAKPKPKPKKEQPAKSAKPPAPKASATTGAILGATNKHRADAGVAALKADSCAEKWARKQAENQAAKNTMSHQSMGPIMSNCGASGAAENVAYGQPSNAAVVKAWFNSPGHKANMLNKGYTHMGAAVAYGSDGAPYYAQVFLKK